MFAIFVSAAPAAPLWEPLEPSGSTTVDLLPGGRVVGSDGVVYRRVGDTWEVEARPPPSNVPSAQWRVDDEGGLWHFSPRPAAVTRITAEGVSAREYAGEPLGTVFAVGHGGRAWVGTSSGRLMARGPDGTWSKRPAPSGYVNVLVPDRRGGVWVGTSATDEWVHFDATGAAVGRLPARVSSVPLVEEDGTVRYAVGDLDLSDLSGAPLGPDSPVPAGLHVLRRGRDLVIDGQIEPAPCVAQRVVRGDSGEVLVRCTDTTVMRRSATSGGPPLARAPWRHGDLGDVVVVDIDGDGADDILSFRDEVRALLQRDGELVTGVVPSTLRSGIVSGAICDLDRDGRPDLVGWTRPAGPGGEQRPLAYRRRVGWWDELAGDAGAPTVPSGTGDVRPPRCVDADGDGDLDVWYPRGTLLAAGGPAVGLLRNTGGARFRWYGEPRAPAVDEWVTDVIPGDFDGDGVRDRVLVAPWRGAIVFDGATGQPRRWGTGLYGLFHEWGGGEAADLDHDGDDDLVLFSQMRGPRVWLGGPAFAFSDATDELGLGALGFDGGGPFVAQPMSGAGRLDLLVCATTTDGDCRYAAGGVEGFVARPFASGQRPPSALTTFDLGADGDLDLLWLQDGDEALFENRTSDAPFAPRPVGVDPRALVFAALARSPGLNLATLLVPFLVGAAGIRRVRTATWWLATTTWCGVWAAAIDLAPSVRLSAAGVAVALLGAGLLSSLAWDAARRAARIDRYQLHGRLGAGGVGTVYLATDTATGERVAVKVLRPECFRDDRDRIAFAREVENGSAVVHPGLVRVLRWGETTVPGAEAWHRTAWIAMELLRGPSLRRLADAEPLDPASMCAVGAALCEALGALHARSIVHGDVKPENVVVTPRGPVLADFGAARVPGDRHPSIVHLTRTYAPPELFAGEAPHPATDIYALAVTLEELRGSSALPDEVGAMVARATGPRTSRPTASELGAALSRYAGALPTAPALDPVASRRWADGAALARQALRVLVGAPAPSVEGAMETLRATERRTTRDVSGFRPTDERSP